MRTQTKQEPLHKKFSQQEWYEDARRTITEDRKQLDLAKKRMGSSPLELLRWVADFASLDLDVRRPEERQAIGYDLRALPFVLTLPTRRAPKALAARGQAHHQEAIGPMPEATLRAIHRGVAEGLRNLFAKQAWELPERKTYLYRCSADGAPRTRFGIRWQAEGEKEAILSAVVELILSAGEKLRACRECGRVFVANRKQRYCTAAHAQKDRNDRKK